MKQVRYRLLALLMGAALALPLGAAAADNEAAKPPPRDLAQKGDAKCTRCHDETEDYPVLAIGKTRHGTVADARVGTCTSCHGESEPHVNKPQGVKERPKADVTYGGIVLKPSADNKLERPAGRYTKYGPSPVAERNAPCLTCHKGGRVMHWGGSLHQARDVACSDCHQIHTSHDRARDRQAQPDVCFACHKEQRAQFNRQSHHPVKEGTMACSDCHNTHGTAGVRMLVRDSVVQTCYTCHMEKRGPFVRTHQPVTEDCTICHNPHGSTTDNLLKVRPPFLCQQCHEPATHQGNIPGMNPGTGNANLTQGLALARSCLNCHTNIHGTNNPRDVSNERTFRR